MSLLELLCDVDDFWKVLEQQRQQSLPASVGQRSREPGLWASEIMTILIHFHQTGYGCFKTYYQKYVLKHLRREFPKAMSYSRFISLVPRVVILLWAYALYRCGRCTGISFVDSTTLRVCHNRRITRHKVLAGTAARGQSSTGWFYGFKLHLVVNDQGEILAFQLTPGNVDDRVPVPTLATKLFGKLFGDKGYLSTPLFNTLLARGIQLVTNLRSNMKNKLTPLTDKLLLRKRWIIETINDQLKNISQIEHSRHRSPANFLVNVLAGLIAYSWQPKKPRLHFSHREASVLSFA
ncbi:MAG: IS982 family transposase [Chloroflexota bacterium]